MSACPSAGFCMFTPMDLYDTLLFVHVLSAFFAVGALTALWGLILGTRGATPSSTSARR